MRCLTVGVFWSLLTGLALGQAMPALELRQAVRSIGDGPAQTVRLPDFLQVVPGAPGETGLRPSYTLQVDLGAEPAGSAIYLPGVLNRAQVRVNGHIVFDRLREPLGRQPRGADRLLFAELPEEFVRAGINTVEITLAAPRWTSLSPVWIGPEAVLRRLYAEKRWWQVFAPVVSAAIILALAVCVLLLWLRQRGETLYAYFGFGGVVWSLHNVWAVLPDPLLPYPHFAIWWNLGFGLFVAPIVVFCVRLAEWRVPRLELALWAWLAFGPLLAYGADALGVLETALTAWRLSWVGVVGVGVAAVGYFAMQRRDLHAALLLTAATAAFAFGVHDWWGAQFRSDNNPVLLTHYSGLVFFPLVAWMLIDGFVQASRQLEKMNAELERRVASKSAELTQALEAMREAKDDAEAANRAKSSFLAAASHDLRQPMHALGLYMAALRGETVDRSQVDLIERMSASVGALDSLFDALLDVSRIDAGAVEPNLGAFELEPMLHRLADDFAQQAGDKGLRLSVRVARPTRAPNAFSDRVLVERILRNLLANAVKYTEDGGVLLSCRLRGAGGAQPVWRIEVWDSGPGIPAAEVEHVYEEFYQLGNPERNRAAGLGLGLSIVRRLTRLLGLQVTLQSMPGHGSRFSLDLPATDAPALTPAEPELAGTLDGLAVAVIDDDPDVRDAMTALLSRWGCRVVAGSGAQEVLAGSAGPPAQRLDAAVVDYQLRDGCSGIDAIRTLRAAFGDALPALLVSGTSSAGKLSDVKASGFAWLSKPVPAARLRSWLVQATRGAP